MNAIYIWSFSEELDVLLEKELTKESYELKRRDNKIIKLSKNEVIDFIIQESIIIDDLDKYNNGFHKLSQNL